MTKINFDFPTEPIGGSNPNYRCASCKRSLPEINGEVENHLIHCEWRIKMENPEVIEEQYVKAVAHYYAVYIKEYSEIRLGQFLCNEFGITDAEVFYEEHAEKAMMIFCSKHVAE